MNNAFGRGQGTSARGYDKMGEGLLSVEFNMPAALPSRHDKSGDEISQSLPPYDRRQVFAVSDYDEHCPPSWTRSGYNSQLGCNELSYFVALIPGRGMWFNMTHLASHERDVAVLMSMQGVNPLTAWPIEGVNLEQYRDRCPKHGRALSADRYCSDCKFKLPGQNYIASTTGQPLWLDGFRTQDGMVRQFLITEDVARGVAAQVLGNKRTSSFAFAIFESRELKPRPSYRRRGYFMEEGGLESIDGGGLKSFSPPVTRGATRSLESRPKSLEVAAGARITQDVGIDPKSLDYWNDRPSVILHLNYTDEETFRDILRAGRRPEAEEGPLAGLRTGHTPYKG